MITIGTDIEVQLTRDSELISAVGMINGTKQNPLIVPGGNLQEDNVNAEYAVDYIDAALGPEVFSGCIQQVQQELIKVLPDDVQLVYSASAEYPERELMHAAARKFGCDSDYSAWNGRRNRLPHPRDIGRFRTCGGHIHVGHDTFVHEHSLIQWMDVCLGVPSLFLDHDRDRRKLYGTAGAYRSKEYGVEYRTLSNFWAGTDAGRQWVFNQTMKAIELAKAGSVTELPDHARVPRSINTYDLSLAESFMDDLEREGVCIY